MVSLLGGLLLCLGAFFTMRGKVYQAVSTYLIADVCWIIMAIQAGNVLGSTFVIIGTIMGLIAFLKMRLGVMDKELEHR